MKDLKLKIELVPSTSKNMNLSSGLVPLYGEIKWYDIAQERRDYSGWKCEICGAESDYFWICGKCTPEDEKCNNCFVDLENSDPFHNYRKQKIYCGLECHERWSYDITEHTQKLIGFIALCKLCHYVKHIRRVEYLAEKCTMDMKTVIDHFMKVNECDENTYKQHRNEVEKEYELRSKLLWDIYFGEYADPKLKYSERRELIRLNPSFHLREEF